jgi:hypothetical protein
MHSTCRVEVVHVCSTIPLPSDAPVCLDVSDGCVMYVLCECGSCVMCDDHCLNTPTTLHPPVHYHATTLYCSCDLSQAMQHIHYNRYDGIVLVLNVWWLGVAV